MSPKKTSTAATDSTADVPVSTDFCADDADVIIRAAGTLDFRVHKTILSLVSPFFKDMFTLPQPTSNTPETLPHVDVQQSAKTWENILRTIYPMPHPIINNLNDLESLLFAARAYDIRPIFDIHKKALENVEFIKQDPLRLFAIARACGLEDQASYVAKNAELLKVAKHPNPDGLEGLSFGAYSGLVSFLVQRDDEWRRTLQNESVPCDCDDQSRESFFGRVKQDLLTPYLQTEEVYFRALQYRVACELTCSSAWCPCEGSAIKKFIKKMMGKRGKVYNSFQLQNGTLNAQLCFVQNLVLILFIY